MTIRHGILLLVFLNLFGVCWGRGISEREIGTPDGLSSWDLELEDLKLEVGKGVILTFPADGESRGVYGTGIYSSHSTIAAAAVHAGLLSAEKGGSVTILVVKGLTYYSGSNRNGITSVMGGRSDRSFVFLDDAGDVVTVPLEIDWDFSPLMIPVGSTISAVLPPGGKDYFVFGSGPYDVYSAIGAAAVQAGLINFRDGGEVHFEIMDISPDIKGVTTNGVTSLDTITGDKSFQFKRRNQ